MTPLGCDDDDTGPDPGSKTCSGKADCDDANPCSFDFCVDGLCAYAPADDGAQPGADQTEGDCRLLACQNGQPAEVTDDDPPEDDGVDCYLPICANGHADQQLAAAGSGCVVDANTDGVCDDAGLCGCSPPTPEAPQYVDPVAGSDDVLHGGASGACAYKTLTFALTQSNGSIELAVATYDAAAGETFPMVLTGNQQLSCPPQGTTRATIVGAGSYDTSDTTIAFEGPHNRVSGCTVAGTTSMTGRCITVSSNAGSESHQIDECDISTCNTGIGVLSSGNGLEIRQSNVHDTGLFGILWAGPDKRGVIDSNTLSNNGSPSADIRCSDPSPLLVGSGNGTPSCQGCASCPF